MINLGNVLNENWFLLDVGTFAYSISMVTENELEVVKALVKEEMENVLKMSVTLEVDTNIGNTWYDAK